MRTSLAAGSSPTGAPAPAMRVTPSRRSCRQRHGRVPGSSDRRPRGGPGAPRPGRGQGRPRHRARSSGPRAARCGRGWGRAPPPPAPPTGPPGGRGPGPSWPPRPPGPPTARPVAVVGGETRPGLRDQRVRREAGRGQGRPPRRRARSTPSGSSGAAMPGEAGQRGHQHLALARFTRHRDSRLVGTPTLLPLSAGAVEVAQAAEAGCGAPSAQSVTQLGRAAQVPARLVVLAGSAERLRQVVQRRCQRTDRAYELCGADSQATDGRRLRVAGVGQEREPWLHRISASPMASPAARAWRLAASRWAVLRWPEAVFALA